MIQQTQETVFISYRRSVGSYLTRAVYYNLKYHGYDVFMDVESINSGMFDTSILNAIEERKHFLIICTPGTFDRINEPGDWLRREIEHALKHNRNIVPIKTPDFDFDDTTRQLLKGKIKPLSRYNPVSVPHDYFEAAMERLRTRFLIPLP